MVSNKRNDRGNRYSHISKLDLFFKRIMNWRGFWAFPIVGLVSMIWFLIRVIPKPSRATYPCMRVAAPLASSFVAYLIGSATLAVAFHKVRQQLNESRILVAAIFTFIGLLAGVWLISNTSRNTYASYADEPDPVNQPFGEAKGIFPGRVVWVHNPDATNEDCIPTKYGHGWFLDENNDQDVIDQMLSSALQEISGMACDSAAWDTLFRYHNKQRGKTPIAYQEGEKIFLKINCTSTWRGNINKDFTIADNMWYGISETSPHLVLSVLRQLVNVVGVSQDNIYVGDPMKHIYKHCYDLWRTEFPNVHYLDHDRNYDGREMVFPSDSAIIYYSDRGEIIEENTDYLYTIFDEAEYLINIPTLKGHKRAGITMFAKNHFGSNTRDGASHLHPGLVNPDEVLDSGDERFGYGLYRVQVDLMGHKLLGGKSLIYLMDALWCSGVEVNSPDKWQMEPFNNDWSSSIFISQDPVAIESVGYDFLKSEYTVERHPDESYAQMDGTDDYLHQAADTSAWPDDIEYDPERDGTPLTSLGVHEHWNNPTDKQYTRNLYAGDGIELIKILSSGSAVHDDASIAANKFVLSTNYPNPFNPETTIRFDLPKNSHVMLEVYNILGQKIRTLFEGKKTAGTHYIKWDGKDTKGRNASSGIYFYKIVAGDFIQVKKMVLSR